jgi:hypothetical protein
MGMSKPTYKARFSRRTMEGDFLNVTVWPGKSDPTAEVIVTQIRRQKEGQWETIARLALYRTSEGSYNELPERPQT